MSTFSAIQQIEFEKMLHAIAWEWVIDPEAKAKFRALGVEPSQWTSSKAKWLLCDFERTQSEKTRLELIMHLETVERGEFAPTEGEFRARYGSQLKLARAKELATRIQSNLGSADEIVASYMLTNSQPQEFKTAEEVLREGFTRLKERQAKGLALVEMPNWPLLSQGIKGFNPGRIIILPAQTGAGKTTLALNWAFNMAQKMPVLFFNMEMPIDDLAPKVYQSLAKQTLGSWFSGNPNLEMAETALSKTKFRLEMSQGTALTIDSLIAKIASFRVEYGPAFVIVDYDQKMSLRPGYDEWKALHLAVQELEQVAIKSECCVLLLAQANDDGKPRASSRMTQSSATQLLFGQDEAGERFIQATKNRFGLKDYTVSLVCDLSIGLIAEAGEKMLPPRRKGL